MIAKNGTTLILKLVCKFSENENLQLTPQEPKKRTEIGRKRRKQRQMRENDEKSEFLFICILYNQYFLYMLLDYIVNWHVVKKWKIIAFNTV